jgi:hypothetical protein
MKLSPSVILIAGIIGCVVASEVQAQQCTHQTIGPITQNAQIFMYKYNPYTSTNIADVQCEAQPGSFVRLLNDQGQQQFYRVHLWVKTEGQCQGLYWVYPKCSTLGFPPQKRYIGASTINANQSYIGPIQPINFGGIQEIDTRPQSQTGTTSTGLNWLAYDGTVQFTSNTVIDKTACNLPPGDVQANPFTVHALACKPEWAMSEFFPVNFYVPPGDITIALPSGFSDALNEAQAAAFDWSLALNRTINVVENATCAVDDPRCVYFTNDQEDGPNDNCASFQGGSYNSDTGAWTHSGHIRLQPKWNGGHTDNLRKTIAHELGHYFGLANRIGSTCTASNTIMQGALCYSATAPAQGTALGPTPDDSSPLNNSTYGNKVRSICGWQ